MSVTKREKTLAIGAAAAVLLAGIGFYAIPPYLDARAKLQGYIKVAQDKYNRERALLRNQPAVAQEWKGLLAGSVRTTSPDASSKMQDALFDAARAADLKLQGVKPDRPVQLGDFQHVHLKATGEGSEASVARWLWTIESSKLPLQVDEFNVTALREGNDGLRLQLDLTTLVFSPPPATRPSGRARTAPTGETE